MRIAIVSKSTKKGGGASKVAEDLANLLHKNGHTVHHYRRDLINGYTEHSTSVYGKLEHIAKKIYFRLQSIGFQEIIPFEYIHLSKEIKRMNYDIIHFHDLTTAVSPYTLMLLSKKIPVVWTLHDCSSFTGGCIYPMDCNNYFSGCYNCPLKNQWPFGRNFDFAFLFFKLKKKLHLNKLYLLAPSNWLIESAQKNNIIKNPIHYVSNGVDIDIYKQLDKKLARKKRGIDPDRFIILLTAGNIADKRKGIDFSLDTLQKLKKLNCEFLLLIVGTLDYPTEQLFSEFDYYKAGYISDEKELNLCYSMADIFLNCSIQDNQPLVVLETMASGTPTVGFETGGIPEMIIQNNTGFLVSNQDTNLLAEKIKEIKETKIYENWSLNCSNLARNKFTHELFYKKHLEMYTKFIEDFNRPSF